MSSGLRWLLFLFVYAATFLGGMSLVRGWDGSADRDLPVMLFVAALASYAALQDVFARSVVGETANFLRLIGVIPLLAVSAMVVVQVERALPLTLIVVAGVVASPFLSLTLRGKRVKWIVRYLGTPDVHCYVGCWGMSLCLVALAGAAYAASVSSPPVRPLVSMLEIFASGVVVWAFFVGVAYRETLTNVMTLADSISPVEARFLFRGKHRKSDKIRLPRLSECRKRVEIAWIAIIAALLLGVPILASLLRLSVWGLLLLSISGVIGILATFDPVLFNWNWRRGTIVSVFCRLSLGLVFLGLYLGRVTQSHGRVSDSLIEVFDTLSTFPIVGSITIIGAVVAGAVGLSSSSLVKPLWPLYRSRLSLLTKAAAAGIGLNAAVLQLLVAFDTQSIQGVTREHVLVMLGTWLAVLLVVLMAALVLPRIKWYRQQAVTMEALLG